MLAIYAQKSYYLSRLMRKLSSHWVYLFFILLFSLLGSKALFHPGLFTAHDIWHQVARLHYYSTSFNNGQFPPYWISNLANGFGYPLFFFSYHLPWIVGLPFLKAGFDISFTLKALFFLAYISSGLSMYLFVNNLLKNRLSALLSSIIYLWAPYHFLTIFVGASMGIVFVFAFLPLLLLGLHLVNDNHKLAIPTIAVGFAGITLSHSMHVLFLAPGILLFALYEIFSSKNRFSFFRTTLLGILLGISLAAFYLLPALYYSQFTKVHQESGFADLYQRNFVNLSQIIYSKWGYGPIVKNAKDGDMSVQLGIAQWLSFAGVIVLLVLKKIKKTFKTLALFILASFLISIFLMLDYSSSIWRSAEKLTVLDFPFRELLSATLFGSISAGILLTSFKKNLQKIVFTAIVLIAFYTNRNHINVNQYTDIPVSTYIESELTTNSFNEYLPIASDGRLLNQNTPIAEGSDLQISDFKQNTNSLSFILQSQDKTRVSIRQFYFPGQTLYIDNKLHPFNIDKKGRINLTTPKGIHKIAVEYQEPFLIRISKFLSLAGALITLVILFKPKLRKKPTSDNS